MSTRPSLKWSWMVGLCALVGAPAATAQVTELIAEPVAIHEGMVGSANLAGKTTYRIYAQLTSAEDYVTAVFGSDEFPLNISTTTTFWQHGAGANFATSINGFIYDIIPESAYDSWLTIGLDRSPSSLGEEEVAGIGLTPLLTQFSAGLSAELSTSTGGSWYVLPGSANGVPDENLRVLLAQVTTSGLVSGTFNLQVFIGGDPFNEQLASLTFGAGIPGCTHSNACNYDPEATAFDGSCEFPEEGYDCNGDCLEDADGDGICDALEVLGCTDELACDYDATATDSGACEYAEEGRDCAGNCLADADGDGVCDGDEVLGCTDSEACNFDALATEADDSCTYPEPELDCAGNCLVDADLDGVCDAFEVEGCTNELANNYDATATDDDGSCSFDPSYYCGEGTVWDEALQKCVGTGSGDGGVGGLGSPCFGDFFGDGAIGTNELILFLSVYDTNCSAE